MAKKVRWVSYRMSEEEYALRNSFFDNLRKAIRKNLTNSELHRFLWKVALRRKKMLTVEIGKMTRK